MLSAGGRARVYYQLRKELSQLAQSRTVTTWENPSSGSLGFIERLNSMPEAISATAPLLVEMLSSIARPSDKSQPMPMGSKQVMWICMFMFSMQSHRCNGFAKSLAL